MPQRTLTLALVLGVVTATSAGAAPQQKKATSTKPPAPAQKATAKTTKNATLTDEQKIRHVLNRLGFGPRPGDIERVQKLGLSAYIEQQLHPETIKDDAIRSRAEGFASLSLTGMDVAERERAVQMSNLTFLRIQKELAEKGATGASGAMQDAISNAQTGKTPPPQQAAQQVQQVLGAASPEQRQQLLQTQQARMAVNQIGNDLVNDKLLRAVESEKQLYEALVDFWSNHFNIDATKVRAAKMTDERDVIRKHAMGKFKDLLHASATSAAMMLYLDNAQSVAAQPTRPNAAFPPRQISLAQVKLGADRGLAPAKQMLERIQELAKNEKLTEEEAYARIQLRTQQIRPGAQGQQGLNENYARELMELHTLGVDGGYTQKDVTEVARCLTGWGVRGGRYSGEFEFHPFQHDKGEKTVLGTTIPAGGGMEDGEKVLELLASHPSTRRYISEKLCRRFVADEPPKSLIEKCVATWQKTDGDIREIVRTIVTSPEFYSEAAYKQKIKSPFEFTVSAVRALGGTLEPPRATPEAPGRGLGGLNIFAPGGTGQTTPRLLAGQIGILGQPLYNYGFPTGYPEDSRKWVSSGALIGRLNYALALVNGRLSDIALDSDVLKVSGSDPDAVMETLADRLGIELSATTKATLLKQIAEKPANDDVASIDQTRRLTALLLGSPEFQRR